MAPSTSGTTTLTLPSATLEVVVAGCGIAGLTVAIALRQHPKINVKVYEQAKEIREIGASIGLGPNGLRTLEKLGIENALDPSISMQQKSDWPMVYRHWKTGEILGHDEHHTVKIKRHSTTRYHRAHLHQALLENVPRDIVYLDKKVVDVKADPEKGVKISFADGTETTADILLGADGIHSVCDPQQPNFRVVRSLV